MRECEEAPSSLSSSPTKTYIRDDTERSNGIGSVPDFRSDLVVHILGETAGGHDDIVGDLGQLLDDQVNHLAELCLLGGGRRMGVVWCGVV